MTLAEARKVAKVLKEADGGCSVCVRELADRMQNEFPRRNWRKMLGVPKEIPWKAVRTRNVKGRFLRLKTIDQLLKKHFKPKEQKNPLYGFVQFRGAVR